MAETQPSKETTPMSEIVPIAIEKSFLEGKGLVEDDPSEYDDYTKSADGDKREPTSRSSSHIFHHDKIHVSVIEAGPDKVCCRLANARSASYRLAPGRNA
jgi:hypothetical protein